MYASRGRGNEDLITIFTTGEKKRAKSKIRTKAKAPPAQLKSWVLGLGRWRRLSRQWCHSEQTIQLEALLYAFLLPRRALFTAPPRLALPVVLGHSSPRRSAVVPSLLGD